MSRLTDIDVPRHLIHAACEGLKAAQAEIYALVAPATFAFIRRLVGHRAVAEDLFQDTMMTLFQRLRSFRGEAPLGAWLRQIAVTRCLMYLRSPWNRARLRLENAVESEDGALAQWPMAGDGPERMLTIQPPAPEELDVERALASLSPTARAVVWLYEVEGYSHEEIAGAYGRSVSFSKSQLARAHRKLRKWFEVGARQACKLI